MKLLLEAPINRLSFGNVSYNFIRELKKLDVDLGIFPIGDLNQLDLSAFDPSEDTKKYFEKMVKKKRKSSQFHATLFQQSQPTGGK